MTTLIDLGLTAERRPEFVRDPLELHIGRALFAEVLLQLDNNFITDESPTTTARLQRLIAAQPAHDWN